MAKETVGAPIPGKVIRILVKVGDKVSEGDTVCEIESMKMENPIMAPVSGTISEILASAGQVLKKDQPIVIITY